MNNNLCVDDIMTKKLITFTPDTQVLNAIDQLISHQISGAPVVDKHGRVKGILSEIDCMKTLLHSAYHNEIGGLVKDYMSLDVNSIPSTMGIVDVAEYFLKTRYRRLPVIDNGKLVGQVSRRDVLKAVQKL